LRQRYVGCGGHGVRGAVLYGGWVEQMFGERVIVGWLGEGGGGGVELVSGGALRCGVVCCGLRCARFDVSWGGMEETGTRVREGMEGGEWRVGSGDAWGDVVSCGVRKSSGCLMGEEGKVLSELMQRSDGGGWDVVKEEW
jgi:hypothetical protein